MVRASRNSGIGKGRVEPGYGRAKENDVDEDGGLVTLIWLIWLMWPMMMVLLLLPRAACKQPGIVTFMDPIVK